MAPIQKHQTVRLNGQQVCASPQSNLHHLLSTKLSSLIHFVESHCVWISFGWVARYYLAHFHFYFSLIYDDAHTH